MDIYSVLLSKPHNPHYLNRYITFIKQCQLKNVEYEGYVEKHHICPKAKDMFPEYESFNKHPWNCAVLTARQHFVAHMMLWKAYPGSYSQTIAINLMIKNSTIKNSKVYEKMRRDYYEYLESRKHIMSEKTSTRMKEKIENGNHVFLTKEFRIKSSERMKNSNPMKKIRINKGSFKPGQKPIITEERNKKVSRSKLGEKNPNYGKKGCFDHINNKRLQCPHCNIETTPGNAKRWHFDNCKNLNT